MIKKLNASYLEQRAGIEQSAITSQADDEINLIRQLIFALAEGHELVASHVETRMIGYQRVVQNRMFHENHHSFFLQKKTKTG